MATSDAGSDKATAALTGAGSMEATSTIAKPTPFQPPGTPSSAVVDAVVRDQLPQIPPLAEKYTAGPGDRGGVLTPEVPSSNGGRPGDWQDTTVAESSSENGPRWTTSRHPVDPAEGGR